MHQPVGKLFGDSGDCFQNRKRPTVLQRGGTYCMVLQPKMEQNVGELRLNMDNGISIKYIDDK